jgi:hypothetical protein
MQTVNGAKGLGKQWMSQSITVQRKLYDTASGKSWRNSRSFSGLQVKPEVLMSSIAGYKALVLPAE